MLDENEEEAQEDHLGHDQYQMPLLAQTTSPTAECQVPWLEEICSCCGGACDHDQHHSHGGLSHQRCHHCRADYDDLARHGHHCHQCPTQVFAADQSIAEGLGDGKCECCHARAPAPRLNCFRYGCWLHQRAVESFLKPWNCRILPTGA